MIQVNRTIKGYTECISCEKSLAADNEPIYQVSLGTDPSDLSSIRICKSCAEQIITGIEKAE